MELSARNLGDGTVLCPCTLQTDAGAPTGKQRVFAVADLGTWKLRLPQRVTPKPTVGVFLGREGHFSIKRPPGGKGVFSFSKPATTLAHGHILGRDRRRAST